MRRHDESRECSGDFELFAEFVNPAFVYNLQVENIFYFDKMKNFWVFTKSTPVEIMYITHQMKPTIILPNELVIKQGDQSSILYFVLNGQFSVFIRNR